MADRGFVAHASMTADSLIFVAGGPGLVGSAVVRRLRSEGFARLLTPRRTEVDLLDRCAVEGFFAERRPEFVFLCAAKVGGIHANSTYGGDFLRDNLLIQTHVIDAAYRFGAAKLLFLGSSCIYPRMAEQPIREEALLSGPLEPTNSPYAVAKIAGIEMCRAYRRQFGLRAISLMPTNLYGPGDNFHPENSHVFAALLRKFHEAKVRGDACVTLWGSGTPRREFLHVDDLADAALFLMRNYDAEMPINVGTGTDVTIRELAELIAGAVGYRGEIRFDTSRPDGVPRKLLDVSRLHALGWRARIDLRSGIESTYRWYSAAAAQGAARE